jgi:drug/metabolite transporter (DMT)-like permease
MIANALSPRARTILMATIAMCCFAANSLLARLALAPSLIDPATFTLVRALSAAAVLSVVVARRRSALPRIAASSWRSICMLLAYLVFFAFAYTRLSAGTGTLILFATVQLSMLSVGIWKGDRLSFLSGIGLGAAALGLVLLVAPGLEAPDPTGFILMGISGLAWGMFSVLARGASDPLEANAANFLGCIPLLLLVRLLPATDFHITAVGVAFAIVSGSIASGLGYVIWYAALKRMQTIHAAAVQLSVPAIAALGGVVVLAEPITTRLVASSLAVVGGVALVIFRTSTKTSDDPHNSSSRHTAANRRQPPIQTLAAASLQRAGDIPNSRLKARLNASSDS